MGTYLFKWKQPAKEVYVTGSFDDWGKTEEMHWVGDHWEREVEFDSIAHPVLFKFVVDDDWVLDPDHPTSGDGHFNVNNVLQPYEITPKPAEAKQDVPGAFPDESAEEPSLVGIQPIPASAGIGNPITLPAGAAVPDQKDITSNTIGSTVTTSEEEYEKGGVIDDALGSKPSEPSFLVDPIPATSGPGNPVDLPAGAPLPDSKEITKNTIGSTATTSKEEYEKGGISAADEPSFSVNPIPASDGSTLTTSKGDYEKGGVLEEPPVPKTEDPSFSVNPIPATTGISNPISLEPGAPIPDQKDITANTIESTATTSKEDYERGGVLDEPSVLKTEEPSFSVNPIPASDGSVLTTSKEDYEKGGVLDEPLVPKTEEPSFSVNPIPASDGSVLTTSKEDYEKGGVSDEPLVPKAEEPSFSVNPIPASDGSMLTTSKEDYEKAGVSEETSVPRTEEPSFSVNPIPASSGIGNPISLEPGAPIPDQKDITPNTVDSTVTTSKEDYEKGGSSGFPTAAAAGVAAGGALGGAALVGAFTQKDKPIIPESGLPMGSGKSEGLVPSPFISSSGPGTTTADLASKVPLESELKKSTASDAATSKLASELEVPLKSSSFTPAAAVPGASKTRAAAPQGPVGQNTYIQSSGPGTTTADLAANVPLEKERAVAVPGVTASHAQPAQISDPFISSSGPGTTTAALAADVPLEKEPFVPGITASHSSYLAAKAPQVPQSQDSYMRSSGPGTTTAALAAEVPLEKKSVAPSASVSQPPQSAATLAQPPQGSDPFIRSSGPGTTTAALAAAVPLEATKQIAPIDTTTTSSTTTAPGVPDIVKESISSSHESPEAVASPEAVKDKTELEKELLSKTHASQATGEPASAALEQTSYYGLATMVPQQVEKSMQQAKAAPEAATEASVVAEKSVMEQELLHKVPSSNEVGEPAPTIAAVTSPTAPESTPTAAATATSITDGKTANEPVPDTDTSSAARGPSAGEVAGGAAVGGAAAAGVAALAAKHKDAETEPPRIADSQKPDITTEASPATAIKDNVPGQSRSAAAAVSDGVTDEPVSGVRKTTAPVETSEAATTEYAPVRTDALSPGVSSSAAAAISDGTEDPTLADEPAVQMMKENEGAASTPMPVATTSTAPTSTTAAPTSTSVPAKTTETLENKDSGAPAAVTGIPSLTSAGTAPELADEKKDTVSSPSATEATGSAPAKLEEKQDSVSPNTATDTTDVDAPSGTTQQQQVSAADKRASKRISTMSERRRKRDRLRDWLKKTFN